MKGFTEHLWKLPPPEQRRAGFPPVTWLHSGIQLTRDGDYLCYLLFKTVLSMSAALLALMLLDIWLRTGLFFDPKKFQHHKLLLPVAFSQIMGPAAFGMTILFYLRARLSVDLRNAELLVLMHKALLLGYSRRRWIFRSVFGISIGLLCIFLSHILVIRLTVHFEMQESLGFILLPQVFQLLGLAGGSLILLSYGLVLEKALRFFPHLEYDLQIRVDDQRQQ